MGSPGKDPGLSTDGAGVANDGWFEMMFLLKAQHSLLAIDVWVLTFLSLPLSSVDLLFRFRPASTGTSR
jgi:hypothetical protein